MLERPVQPGFELDELQLTAASAAKRAAAAAAVAERLVRELQACRRERESWDERFAAAVRAAAARLFAEVRGREPTVSSSVSPAWHKQPRPAQRMMAGELAMRPLVELLGDTRATSRGARAGAAAGGDRIVSCGICFVSGSS